MQLFSSKFQKWKRGMEKHCLSLGLWKASVYFGLTHARRQKLSVCSCFSNNKEKDLTFIYFRYAVLCILHIFVFQITWGCWCYLQSSERLSTFPEVTELENGPAMMPAVLQSLAMVLCASPPLRKRNRKMESHTRYFFMVTQLKCSISFCLFHFGFNTITHIYN